MKWFVGILSITIGIKLWLAPQISEHCPKNNPGRLIKKLVWFNRPGDASIFTPSEGTAQEWRTSVADTRIRIWLLIGKITRLSTSNNRKVSKDISFWGIMYESNSIPEKSEYS